MTKFINGPAAGVVLELKRAPILLRAVRSRDGNWDALDQLDDEAASDEEIVVYRIVSRTAARAHVCRSPRRLSGWIEWADYKLLAEQPADTDVRTTAAWQSWCSANKERLQAAIKAEDESELKP